MSDAIKNWKDLVDELDVVISRYQERIKEARLLADKTVIPSNIRKAEPEDIRKGNVLWYPRWEGQDCLWMMIEHVLRPDDEWKAYVGDDGCRYGLDGAYVEVTE